VTVSEVAVTSSTGADLGLIAAAAAAAAAVIN